MYNTNNISDNIRVQINRENLPFPAVMMFPSCNNLLKVFPLSSGVTGPAAPASCCVIPICNNILIPNLIACKIQYNYILNQDTNHPSIAPFLLVNCFVNNFHNYPKLVIINNSYLSVQHHSSITFKDLRPKFASKFLLNDNSTTYQPLIRKALNSFFFLVKRKLSETIIMISRSELSLLNTPDNCRCAC